jgi:uncharacterized membrane protein
MAFCPNCGSQADGSFCPKCGAALGAAPGGAAAGGAQMGGVPTGGVVAPAGTSGMTDNVAGALCYLVGFITGIIFLVMEPYSKRPFVRYHAWQSIIFSVAWFIFSWCLAIVLGGLALAGGGLWTLFLLIRGVIGLGGFLLWLFLMFKAYNNERFELPVIGPLAAKQAGS